MYFRLLMFQLLKYNYQITYIYPQQTKKTNLYFIRNSFSRQFLLKKEKEYCHKKDLVYVLKEPKEWAIEILLKRQLERRKNHLSKKTNQKKVKKLYSNYIFPTNINRDELAQKVINLSRKYIGTPYIYAGISPKGFDCSGFTSYIYNQCGINIPHGSNSQVTLGKFIPKKEAKVGDIVFFGRKRKNGSFRTNHVAIVISEKGEKLKMIHSARDGIRIDIENSENWKSYYKKKFLFVKRYF